MKYLAFTLTFFCLAIASMAQKKVGDYIESVNNNLDQSRSPRALQYVPKDGAFYCINGDNRFTRALYGSNTDYRIETSDRPIFAIYKSKNYRSLRFVMEYGGTAIQLDSTSVCESYYKEGTRAYILKDNRWGTNASLHVEVVALPDSEGAIWRFHADGFNGNVKLISKLCNIANPKLHRNGDLGADKPGVFEPSPKDEGLVTADVTLTPSATTAYATLDVMTLALNAESASASKSFEDAKLYFKELSSRVQFTTPDPWLNTLGGALVLAADGCWDGETWLHGAIGWRMPLAGWRAGYLGDVMGWNERAISHFDAYAASQVTDKPAIYSGARQDSALNMARAEKKWGTEMYSNGYICRNPNRNNQMHHYDMNLNYMDELLWHFQYDADTAYMRKMWPVLQRHLAWEKLNFDSDNDHLYDAYCCIWASDALFYSDGAVTHSSAYNYRGNLLAARIAEIIGEDATPYKREAEAIRNAMNTRLWVKGALPHWAEYQESMGNRRLHPDAALWSVYTPVDCGVGTPEQVYQATRYVTAHNPHIPVQIDLARTNKAYSEFVSQLDNDYAIISTSDWMPYSWSINNVASAEIMHTALAYFEAGNATEGYKLLKSNVMDQMYLGQSPGNFGQINYYDAARGECYRDFGDNVGISSRALVQGLFGIIPQALDGKCVIRPGFPLSWDNVEVKTPYLSYKYNKVSATKAVLHISQNFRQPLQLIVRVNCNQGAYQDYCGTTDAEQVIEIDIPETQSEPAIAENASESYDAEALGLILPTAGKLTPIDLGIHSLDADAKISGASKVSDIFNEKYLSPRPASTSLELPVQGIGEWCHPQFKPEVNDSAFRSLIVKDRITIGGIPFITPAKGNNIIFTSLWDNFPKSVTIPVKAKKAESAYLLMAGSTNHMQSHLDNAIITANYTDGTADTLHLIPPYNWCPIEQDYFVDGLAFNTIEPRPLRVCLGKLSADNTLIASRNLGKALPISATEVYGREIPGGAAQILCMPLDRTKKLKSFTLTTVACDVVIGIMGITLK